jgi:hypothetical protein
MSDSRLIPEDTVVRDVIEKYRSRSEVGIRKYGMTLDREDLDKKQWLVHLQEELMDATLYIQKLIKLVDEVKSMS